MAVSEVLAELAAVRAEIATAVDVLFDATEAALALARERRPSAEVEVHLCAIVEALSFQDITGQRLSRIVSLLGADAASVEPQPVSLENGPALPGVGLTQEDANALLHDHV